MPSYIPIHAESESERKRERECTYDSEQGLWHRAGSEHAIVSSARARDQAGINIRCMLDARNER